MAAVLAAAVIVARPGRPRRSIVARLRAARSAAGHAVSSAWCLPTTPGAAFSFLADAGRLAALVLRRDRVGRERRLIVCMLRRGGEPRCCCAGLALILGGALGNLWDRVALGKVVDFLLFHYDGWSWPAFNVADSAITVGAALLILDSFRQRRRRPRLPTRRKGQPMMDVMLANPRGFCAGVDRAIAIVEQALAQFGAPIYVRHEVVHNKFVVDDLKRQGRDLRRGTRRGSQRRHRRVLRARRVAGACAPRPRRAASTCSTRPARWSPRCTSRSRKMREQGREIVMIGHAGHPEVEGTMGQSNGGMYLVETSRTSPRSRSRDPGQARLRHADHAVGRRRRRAWSTR